MPERKPADLVELLLVAIAILGFTAAINAVPIAREILPERGLAVEPVPPTADDGTRAPMIFARTCARLSS